MLMKGQRPLIHHHMQSELIPETQLLSEPWAELLVTSQNFDVSYKQVEFGSASKRNQSRLRKIKEKKKKERNTTDQGNDQRA